MKVHKDDKYSIRFSDTPVMNLTNACWVTFIAGDDFYSLGAEELCEFLKTKAGEDESLG